MNEDMLDTALYYATEYRWPIFLTRGKQPLTTHGFKDATTDPDQIERWLRQYPNANIASPSGIEWDVLDIDDSDAAKRLQEYGVLPMTVKQKTPSGPDRVHHFWNHRAGITNRRGALPKGVDVRGEGGYVLLPPSTGYEWLTHPEDHDRADWPQWLLDIVQRGVSEKSDTDQWQPLDVEAIVEGVDQGERDETAFRYACSLRGRDVPKREALALMKLAWEQMEQPQRDEFPLEDAQEKARRAYKRFDPNRKEREQPATPLRVRSPDMDLARPHIWVWNERIPLGYLSLLLGEEGVGKGTLIRWVIAQLTLGKLDGEYRGTPIHVGIIGDEDDFNNVWTPGLDVVEADPEYVHYIDRPDFGYIELDEDQERIAAVVREFEIHFLYLDQLSDNLGVRVDDWRRKQMRDALRPARAVARELDVAVTGALHPNKHGNTFRELISGSPAVNEVSRSSLWLTTRPDDPDRRVLVRGKGNLSDPPSAVEFDIKGYRFRYNDYEFRGPMVDLDSVSHSDLTMGELIGQDAKSAEALTKTDRAKELIAEMLPTDGQRHLSKPIIEAGEKEGIPYLTMYRAAKKVGVVMGRTEESQARSLWWRPLKVTMRRKGDQ